MIVYSRIKDKSKNKPYIIVEISDKIMVNIMKKVRQILNIDSLHKNNIMGENVTVAVLDTGIYNHPDFGERIIKYKDFVNGKTATYYVIFLANASFIKNLQ